MRLALLLIVFSTAPLLHAQRADSLALGVRVRDARADTNSVVEPAIGLSTGCQVSRGAALGLAGYLGYLIGQLAQFPLALNSDAGESVAINVAGAVTGVILFADAPLSRPLPFCPETLRTVANRPTNHAGACSASRVLNAGLGAAAGAVVAGGLAIPFVLSNSGRGVARGMLVALPVAGAIGGAIRAGNAPPCA